jgi:nucleoprotein TPR
VVAKAKVALQDQLTSLSTSHSSASTEFETLKRHVDDTEWEKRELVGVISRLKEDVTQCDGEYASPFVP